MSFSAVLKTLKRQIEGETLRASSEAEEDILLKKCRGIRKKLYFCIEMAVSEMVVSEVNVQYYNKI